MRPHVLSPEAERVLSLAGDNMWAEIDLNEIPSDFEKTFGSLLGDLQLPTITDEEGKPVQLTLASYGKYRGSSDRRVRKDAVHALFSSLHSFRNTLASVLAGQARFTVYLARAHGFPTALDAYLTRDAIDPQVYKSLIAAVRSNIGPLHRYVALRKKVMKLDEVRLFDLYPPLVDEVDMKFTYEEARKILPVALAPLGEAYLEQLERGMDPNNGWIDVYPHKDKDSGAFAASVYGVHPFVKVNWFDDLEGLSTLAHEYGHAIHSHLAMTNQSEITWSYKPFIAEIASTINEKLLSDYLLAHAKTDDERLFLLNQLVETLRTTIYRQTMFAEFELGVHTAVEMGEPVTADMLDEMYRELVRDYYGPDFTVGEHDGIEWAYVPHFYYKYYVFSYATGLSSGLALAELIQQKGEPARDAFLAMLSAGSSKPPLELLKDAGVDLTKPDAVDAAARLFDATLAEMERLLAKKAAKSAATRS
jgi:oligoendopeptidase F